MVGPPGAVLRVSRMPDESTQTHFHENPIERAVAEYVERRLGSILDQFQQRVNDAMTQATDDLAAAVTALTGAVTAAVSDIQTLATQIAAANASNDSAAIETAVGQINTLAANLNAAVAPAQAAATAAAKPAA